VEQDVGQLYVAVDDGFVVEVAVGGGVRERQSHAAGKADKQRQNKNPIP
jgi:hypothetical protein